MDKQGAELFLKKDDDLYRTDLTELFGAGKFDVHTKNFNVRIIEELTSLIRQYPEEYKKLINNKPPSNDTYRLLNDNLNRGRSQTITKIARLLLNWRMINKFLVPKTNKQNFATIEQMKPKPYTLLDFKIEALGGEKDELIILPLSWKTLIYLFVFVETDINIDSFELDEEVINFIEQNSKSKIFEIDNINLADREEAHKKYKNRKNIVIVKNNIKKITALETDPSFEEIHEVKGVSKRPDDYSDDLPERNKVSDYEAPSVENKDNRDLNQAINELVGAGADLDENSDQFQIIIGEIELLIIDRDSNIEEIEKLEKIIDQLRTNIEIVKASTKIEFENYVIYLDQLKKRLNPKFVKEPVIPEKLYQMKDEILKNENQQKTLLEELDKINKDIDDKYKLIDDIIDKKLIYIKEELTKLDNI